MKQYIGLDMSLAATGVAVITGDEVMLQTIVTNKNDFPCSEERISFIVSKVITLISTATCNICIERPIVHGANKKGSTLLFELSGVLKNKLWREGHPRDYVYPVQVKKFATGSGKAEKENVIDAVIHKWSVNPKDDNQADAFVLAKIAQALDRANSEPLKDYQVDVLNAIVGNPVKKARKTRPEKRKTFPTMAVSGKRCVR